MLLPPEYPSPLERYRIIHAWARQYIRDPSLDLHEVVMELVTRELTRGSYVSFSEVRFFCINISEKERNRMRILKTLYIPPGETKTKLPEHVEEALISLSSEEKKILFNIFWESKEMRTIAKENSKSLHWVFTKYHTALSKLKGKLVYEPQTTRS